MGNKKKFHGGLKVLLLLLFTIFLGSFSTCYASISKEFVDYAINNINTYGSWGDQNTYTHNVLTNLTDSNIEYITNYINLKLIDSNIQNLNDRNCILITRYNSGYIDFIWTFSNVTSPDQYTDLGYLNLYKYNNSDYFGSYDGNIYYLTMILRDNNSFTNITFASLLSGSGNIMNFWPAGAVSYSSSGGAFFTVMRNISVGSTSSVIRSINPYSTSGTQVFSFARNRSFYDNINEGAFIPEPEPEPELPPETSTGDITNNSGEKTGSIDLSGIENGITNIQNQISGDTQKVIENQNQNTQTIVNALSGETEKITNTLTDSADDLIDNIIITSGDIESALNFEIAQDPYSNFWFTLTNNLKSALLGTKRSIDISFQGRTWTISLDEYMVLPAWLIIILTPFSTAFFTWVLVRQFKLIFDKLASGNVDSLLKENSEERHL